MDHVTLQIKDVTDMSPTSILLKFVGTQAEATRHLLRSGPCDIQFSPTNVTNQWLAWAQYDREHQKLRALLRAVTPEEVFEEDDLTSEGTSEEVGQAPTEETGPSNETGLMKAEKLMKKMGYQEGRGLGRNLQGNTMPVQLVPNQNREGLGASIDNHETEGLRPSFVRPDQQREETENNPDEPSQITKLRNISNNMILMVIKGNQQEIVELLNSIGPCMVQQFYAAESAKTNLIVTYEDHQHKDEATNMLRPYMQNGPQQQEEDKETQRTPPTSTRQNTTANQRRTRVSEQPVPRPTLITGPLDDTEGLRFCALVPMGMSHEQFRNIFAAFGPLDHIQFILQKNQQAGMKYKKYMAFVQYFEKEHAQSAIDYGNDRFKQRWAAPRHIPKDMKEFRGMHPVCGRMADRRNRREHETICKIQNPDVQITHKCGMQMLYRQLDQHFENCPANQASGGPRDVEDHSSTTQMDQIKKKMMQKGDLGPEAGNQNEPHEQHDIPTSYLDLDSSLNLLDPLAPTTQEEDDIIDICDSFSLMSYGGLSQ